MTSKTRTLIQSVITRFYKVHHNKEVFENELVDEVNAGRVQAFSETKRRAVEAIDYRIGNLTKSLEILKAKKDQLKSNYLLDDLESRIDEMETLRHYVKGMVIEMEK